MLRPRGKELRRGPRGGLEGEDIIPLEPYQYIDLLTVRSMATVSSLLYSQWLSSLLPPPATSPGRGA